MKKYTIAGIMSGTSLDGVDIACCEFIKEGENWNYKILKAETISFPEYWLKKLPKVETESAFDLALAHSAFGNLLGELAASFLKKNNLIVDYVSSHGHTIFHQPDKRLTFQLGSGAAIAAASNQNAICDFRTTDVAFGGQGAPLVPIGDQLLFSEYDACLNLGGFANISFDKDLQRIAYDICPVNIVANELAKQKSQPYDNAGNIGKSGKINVELLEKLNALPFYHSNFPKSLGKEWVIENISPFFKDQNISVEDKLRTLYEHIAIQISNSINLGKCNKVLVTGGGAHNAFLIELLKEKNSAEIIIPDDYTINFKEALIFAFLGVLRVREEHNCLSSVTGAQKNNVGGTIYLCK